MNWFSGVKDVESLQIHINVRIAVFQAHESEKIKNKNDLGGTEWEQ